MQVINQSRTACVAASQCNAVIIKAICYGVNEKTTGVLASPTVQIWPCDRTDLEMMNEG